MAQAEFCWRLTTLKREEKPQETTLEWDDYCTALASLTAQRSPAKQDDKKVGVCIASGEDQMVVSTGYNSMPHLEGIDNDSKEKGGYSWDEDSDMVCHAVMNAILNKNTPSLEGCTIYTTMFPCNKCAQLIIQSKIAEIVSLSDECETHDMVAAEAARNLFNAVPEGETKPRVTIRDYEPSNGGIVIPLFKIKK